MNSVHDIDYKDKKILLRIDMNSTIINGVVQDNPRIRAHAETINKLKDAKIIIISHQGRPGNKNFLSLLQHKAILEKHIKRKITFVKHLNELPSYIEKMKRNDIILLDNIRKYADEFSSSSQTKLVKILSENTDIYVNDAFSVCHRNQASVAALPKIMEHAAGPNLIKELNALESLNNPASPVVYLLAGAKPEDSVKIIKNKKADIVLVGGLVGELFVKARGIKFGAKDKLLDEKMIPDIYKLKDTVIVPLDFKTTSKNISQLQFPVDEQTWDIGEKTISEFKSIIESAGTVIANGTLGCCEKGFIKGSLEIYRAIEKSRAFTFVCGGDTTEFLRKEQLTGFSHISLAGGAMLCALAGEKLPGIEALKK